jgi:protein PET117
MYQGVLRDEKRVKEKALALLNHPIETLQDTLHSASSGPSGTHASPPLNTPSSPVSQPAPVMDEDCVTCKISPPPQLVEAQSKELRAKERQERLAEYEAQKSLGDRLSREQAPPRVQPAQAQESSRRLV